MNIKDVSILIIDDQFSVRDSLCKWFRYDGFDVETAENAAEAFDKFKKKTWDIILLDIKMPGVDGIEFNQHIQKACKDIIVIIITAYATIDTAVQAIKDGAFEYISKPIDPENISLIIRNALEKRQLKRENMQLRQHIEDLTSPDDIVGQSIQLRRVLKMVASVAKNRYHGYDSRRKRDG